MFKPHVHPRVSGMSVRAPDGNLYDPMLPTTVHPNDPDMWFRNYGRFLAYYMRRFDFDALCVADEMSGVYGYSSHWRRLIGEVRQITDAPLTCAFNWWVVLRHQNRALLSLVELFHYEDNLLDDLMRRQKQEVVFEDGAKRRLAVDTFREDPDWADALDFVGINFYFPLTNELDPSLDALKASWRDYPIATPFGTIHVDYVKGMRDWAASIGKPLLFTEGGWGRWNGAAAFPGDWYAMQLGTNLDLQARCYEAFFSEAAPLSVGMFFWDWAEGGYSPEGGPAETVIRQRFLSNEER